MLYVLKDDQDNIIAVSEKPLTKKWQSIDLHDQSLLNFLKIHPEIGSKLMKSADVDFIRVVEDVIDLLIHKSVIQFTELPTSVQEKLLSRRRLREEIRVHADTARLIDDEDNIF